MSQIMHTLRFVVGMSMLAGGAVLAQPFASAVLAARQTAGASAPSSISGEQPGLSAMMIGAGGHAIPDARLPLPSAGPEGPVAGVDQFAAPPHDRGQWHGQFSPAAPPAPPAPLPASGLEFSPATPPLEGTYRSTVDIPPPPLLDGHAPPPLAAGWSAHDVGRASPFRPAVATPSVAAPSVGSHPVANNQVAGPAIQPSALPAEYVVRDGDDLTGIALKVYGHAGAATAIWTANRDRLTDPQLLPIGQSLRLPPSWTLPAHGQGAAGGPAIEPALAGSARVDGGGMAAGTRPAVPSPRTAAESFWLERPASPPVPAMPTASSAGR